MKFKKYTTDDIKNAVKSSASLAGVLKVLGIIPAGGNYTTLHKSIKRLGLDISHFTGKAWNKGKKIGTKIDTSEYTSNKRAIGSNKLKLRLLKERIFNHQCSMCLKKEWLGKPIPLELHHIDGNRENNCIENLQLLCPNCHTFTPTYRGRNIKSVTVKLPKPQKLSKLPKLCQDCNKKISKNAILCKSCAGHKIQKTKIQWPTIEEINSLLKTMSYVALGKKLGVSDNAIRKHIRNIKPLF